MFKVLKSKKGFTLVELMIVVVIMAILVAVAVPIFSAVTKNARAKTCIGNQREIISALGNWLMLQPTEKVEGVFYSEGGQDAPRWSDNATVKINGVDKNIKKDLDGLFKTVPVCPDPDSKIQISITPGESADTKATLVTACTGVDAADHVVQVNVE